jgi:hypothetical protein
MIRKSALRFSEEFMLRRKDGRDTFRTSKRANAAASAAEAGPN